MRGVKYFKLTEVYPLECGSVAVDVRIVLLIFRRGWESKATSDGVYFLGVISVRICMTFIGNNI